VLRGKQRRWLGNVLGAAVGSAPPQREGPGPSLLPDGGFCGEEEEDNGQSWHGGGTAVPRWGAKE